MWNHQLNCQRNLITFSFSRISEHFLTSGNPFLHSAESWLCRLFNSFLSAIILLFSTLRFHHRNWRLDVTLKIYRENRLHCKRCQTEKHTEVERPEMSSLRIANWQCIQNFKKIKEMNNLKDLNYFVQISKEELFSNYIFISVETSEQLFSIWQHSFTSFGAKGNKVFSTICHRSTVYSQQLSDTNITLIAITWNGGFWRSWNLLFR